MKTVPRLTLLAASALAIAALSACSAPEAGPTPTAPPATTAPSTPEPTTEPSTEPTPEPEESEEPVAQAPTCENILYSETVTQLQQAGWTYEVSDFYLGAMIIDGGIQCMWGDFTVASDHVEIYGWAPIDEATAREAQRALISEGWLREDANGSVYITENPDYALALDEDGYGVTYLFRDDWVALADVKASLPLITWRG